MGKIYCEKGAAVMTGWETFQFGRLYLDGILLDIPKNPLPGFDTPKYPFSDSPVISMGDTCDGQGITWVKPDNMGVLVADRVLLCDVAWSNINQDGGFAEGGIVTIEGRQYLCRMLRGGVHKDDISEWNDIIAATSNEDKLWHWKGMYFWLNAPTSDMDWYQVQGNLEAQYVSQYYMETQSYNIGFRPVLEPLRIFAKPSSNIVNLDGQRFVVSQLQGATHNRFFPQLSPLKGNPFARIQNGTTIKMYTLLCDEVPVRQDIFDKAIVHGPGVKLTFTDKYYGDEFLISWVMMNGVAVAAHSVLEGISQAALKKQGFLE